MRPIDADALAKKVRDAETLLTLAGSANYATIAKIINAIITDEDIAPTIDYEPVIRCKDCMWWKTGGCWFHQPGKCVEREANDFCSDGQRRGKDEAD